MHKSLHKLHTKHALLHRSDAHRVPSTRYLRARIHNLCGQQRVCDCSCSDVAACRPSFDSSVLSVINIYQQIRYSNTFPRIFASAFADDFCDFSSSFFLFSCCCSILFISFWRLLNLQLFAYHKLSVASVCAWMDRLHTSSKLHRRCRSVEQSTLDLYTRQIDNIRLYSSVSVALLPLGYCLCRWRFFYSSYSFTRFLFYFVFFFFPLSPFVRSCNWPHNYCIRTCNDDIYFQFDFPLCILVFISLCFVCVWLRFIYCFELH